MGSSAQGNVGIAFALVLVAGLSTVLGAAVVFTPGLAKFATPRFLAGGLAFSAGVMTYIAFVEIFQKSVTSFENAGHLEGRAYTFATLCFFVGVIITIVSSAISSAQLSINTSVGIDKASRPIYNSSLISSCMRY